MDVEDGDSLIDIEETSYPGPSRSRNIDKCEFAHFLSLRHEETR